MNITAKEMHTLITAAKALGAPLYGLDRFAAATELVEAERERKLSEPAPVAPENPIEHFVTFSDDLDAELEALSEAAKAAWAFVASRYLPASIGAPLCGDLADGIGKQTNDAIIAGNAVAKRRIGKVGG